MVEEASAALDRLAAGPRRFDRYHSRDSAILALLESGVSVPEIARLRRRNVDLDPAGSASARVRVDGAGRRSAVELTGRAKHLLTEWVSRRMWRPDEPLFWGRRRQPLSESAIRKVLKRCSP